MSGQERQSSLEQGVPLVGICSYGVYVPSYRLDRRTITTALGSGGGRGTRAVASYDEDSTSMAVEAARHALRGHSGTAPSSVLFATTSPAYLDKTNASTIHAALRLDAGTGAYDLIGAVRSAAGALRLGLGQPHALVVAADMRSGRPGSAAEVEGGDGAAAFVLGSGPDVIAEFVAWGAASAEFLDRWRVPGEADSRLWEERFGETAYRPLVESAVDDALKAAGAAIEDVAHLVVAGTHTRAVRAARKAFARGPAGEIDVDAEVGNAGTADLFIRLADVLDRAQPGELILAVLLADGADAVLLRATPAVAVRRGRGLTAACRAATMPVTYPTFLTWRGVLDREPPRRPDPDSPAAPPSARNESWKFGFVGSRCTECDTRHLPPQRVCVSCGATDSMLPEPLADEPGRIATFTVDRLAFSLSPPVLAAVVDLQGGGRFQCELTDVDDPSTIRIGDPVTLTFRRLTTGSTGIHNYFWKARPATIDTEEGP